LPVANGGTNLSSTPANGQVLIGNGTGYTLNTLSGAGTVAITNTAGGITITGSGGAGTVTSVGGTGSVNGITLSGTVTSAGSLTLGGTLSNVSLSSQVTGTLPIGNGGTGSATQNFVDLSTTQTVGGAKTWSGANTFSGGITSTTYNFNATTSLTYSAASGGFVQLAIGSADAGVFKTGSATFPGTVVSNVSGGYSALGSNSVTFYSATTGIYSDGSTMGFQISNSLKMFVNSSGSTFNVTGTYGTISDARIKENIIPARSYLSDLCKLNVVNYNIKNDNNKYLGFIAQDVEKVMPGLVDTNKNEEHNIADFKSIKTSVMIPMLVQAIQELKAEIDALKAAR
jgi:hypothetical protein